MLDYTRAIFNKTQKDLEKSLTFFQFGTQVIYIAYLIYLLFVPNSIWYLHLTLLIISIAYFVFDIITSNAINAIKSEKISLFKKSAAREKLAREKRLKNKVRKIKFYLSHIIKLVVLSSMLYPIIVSPSVVHPLSVMCATVMILLWVIQIIFEVLRAILEGRGELFMEAIRADFEAVSKPINAVKSTINKITGKDPEPTPEKNKDRIYLDNLVSEQKAEKMQKRAAEKAERNEKISSWLENTLSKVPFRKAATNENDDEKSRDTVEVDDFTEKV